MIFFLFVWWNCLWFFSIFAYFIVSSWKLNLKCIGVSGWLGSIYNFFTKNLSYNLSLNAKPTLNRIIYATLSHLHRKTDSKLTDIWPFGVILVFSFSNIFSLKTDDTNYSKMFQIINILPQKIIQQQFCKANVKTLYSYKSCKKYVVIAWFRKWDYMTIILEMKVLLVM